MLSLYNIMHNTMTKLSGVITKINCDSVEGVLYNSEHLSKIITIPHRSQVMYFSLAKYLPKDELSTNHQFVIYKSWLINRSRDKSWHTELGVNDQTKAERVCMTETRVKCGSMHVLAPTEVSLGVTRWTVTGINRARAQRSTQSRLTVIKPQHTCQCPSWPHAGSWGQQVQKPKISRGVRFGEPHLCLRDSANNT